MCFFAAQAARTRGELQQSLTPDQEAEEAKVIAFCNGRFAFCGMATCETTPEGGLAPCACWVGNGASIAPGTMDGALTTNQTGLCETMETVLYSTAPQNATISVPTAPAAAYVPCPTETVS